MPGFKSDLFVQADFKPRSEVVDVPDLKDWFEADQNPVWTVRGLEGYEVARTKKAAERNRDMLAIAEAFVSGGSKELTEAIKERLGDGEAIPDNAAERVESLVIGSVDPVIDHQLAVKLCTSFPVVFYHLTNKILQLTGQGAELGKSPGSGEIQKSE